MRLLPERPLVGKIIYSMCKVKDASRFLHQSLLIVRITDLLKQKDNYCK